MGKIGELELISILRSYGMNCEHNLNQKKITDFIPESELKTANYWLDENNKLPRKRHTMEIDIFSWKESHWGALAIEQKSQNGNPKTLVITEDLRLYSNKVELWNAGRELFLQCKGAGYLGRAFASVNRLNTEVIPVGVVDYSLNVFGTPAKWVLYNGVFFVNSNNFEEFLVAFLDRRSWVHDITRNRLT
ncbi:MAG: hypothetical protein J7L23_04190 [Candidatus Diapherotrites archaeon]|nr:hypothetical protein [Candidatus Diapherotrites archaeon]